MVKLKLDQGDVTVSITVTRVSYSSKVCTVPN